MDSDIAAAHPLFKQNNKRQHPTLWLKNVSGIEDLHMRIIISLIKYFFTMKVALNAYSIHDNFSLMSAKVQALWR